MKEQMNEQTKERLNILTRINKRIIQYLKDDPMVYIQLRQWDESTLLVHDLGIKMANANISLHPV